MGRDLDPMETIPRRARHYDDILPTRGTDYIEDLQEGAGPELIRIPSTPWNRSKRS